MDQGPLTHINGGTPKGDPFLGPLCTGPKMGGPQGGSPWRGVLGPPGPGRVPGGGAQIIPPG